MPQYPDGTEIHVAEWNRLIGSIPADYTIYLKDGVYYAESLVSGKLDYNGATKATIQQNAVDALTTGGTIYLKEITLDGTVTYGNTILIIEDYQGARKIYSNQGKQLGCPLLTVDPSTAGWGASQKGFWWYNTTSNVYKYWDGTSVQTFQNTAGVGLHNILSATHGDSLVGAVVRGDVIIGNATPKFSRLAIGAANKVLKSNGTDAAWGNVAYPELTGSPTYKFAPSHTFYEVAGTFYAENTDGIIEYTGTDATTVLNSALADGGLVFVKEGDYYLNKVSGQTYCLLINNVRAWLQGEGIGKTVFHLNNSQGADIIKIVNCYYIKISDLQLDGNKLNQTSGNGIWITSTTPGESYHTYEIQNVEIDACKDRGIYLYSSTANTYTNRFRFFHSAIGTCGSHGIDAWGLGYEFFVSDSTIAACDGNGLYLRGIGEGEIKGNNLFENLRGIYLYDSTALAIGQNFICTSDQEGILLGGSTSRCTVMGNVVYDNSYSAPDTYNGIKATDTATELTIVGNSVYDHQVVAVNKTQCQGIAINAGTFIVVKGNNCHGNRTSPYYIADGVNLDGSYDGIAQTRVSLDLSGGAQTLVCFHPKQHAYLVNASLLYTEASSGDVGVTIKIGKETDDDYYYTGTSEVSKALWYEKIVTLLQRNIDALDTVLFSTAGGKVGTGEVMLIIDYLTGV